MQLIYTDISDIQLNNEETGKLTESIPEYFREKVRASKNERLKLQRLASGLLFTYAMRQIGCDVREIKICKGAQGKPVLIKPAGIYFNLSHSGELVLLAVCDAEVGCDIQCIRDGGKVAERFFTEEEKRILQEADEADRDRSFTRFWARKESYIKATGEGMKRDLRSYSVTDDVTPDGHVFADYDLGGYMASVCMRQPFDKGDICLIPFQKLVNEI